MSISYHGVVGHTSKATLPSVETWGTNMNILRDPPASIQTRKIDKAFYTSEITQMIQESGDRANEAIMVYSRGSNPMTAISFDNYGTNGGSNRGVNGARNVGGRTQSFLPHRTILQGAFRDSQKDQRQLLPLSRLPRVWTSSFTQPGFADFSKKAVCPSVEDKLRGVKSQDTVLKACVRPTATYNIQTPIIEPFEVKYVIKNPVKVKADSGINYNGKFNGEMGAPVKQIHEAPLRHDFTTNVSGPSKPADLNNVDTSRYTHDTLQGDYGTNFSQNIQITPIEEIYNTSANMVANKNLHNTSYTAPETRRAQQEYIHQPIELERALPYYESRTNIGHNIYRAMDDVQHAERVYSLNRPNIEMYTTPSERPEMDNNMDRTYSLRPTINAGGFDPIPSLPYVDRADTGNSFDYVDNPRSRMGRRIYDMQQERNMIDQPGPYVPPDFSPQKMSAYAGA